MRMLSMALVLLLLAETVQAAVEEREAERVILGEAADQGLQGMTAVAEVIRRRGGLESFCAARRKDLPEFVARQPERVRRLAHRAWKRSQHTNVARGATHFENERAFGRPRWARQMRVAARVGDLVFYREQ